MQRNTRTTIATGENHYLRGDFQRLIVDAGLAAARSRRAEDRAVGGPQGGRPGRDALRQPDLHNISGPIGTMAGVHLCAAIPNLLALEWHAASVPFFDALVKGDEQPLIRHGKIRVPDAPGLGIEFDEEAAYQYRKRDEKYFGA